MNTLPRFLCVAATLLLGASAALAGSKFSYPVTVNVAGRSAYGAQGTARNSADGSQYLQCALQSYSAPGTWVSCYARDAAGNSGSCYSYATNLIQMAQGITSDAYLSFAWDASGVCTSLYVATGSSNEPKQP